MSKELEALKFIKNVEVWIGNDYNTATKVFEIDHEYDKAFEIVETALKRLEKIEDKKIVGTTTMDKALEKFMLDNCPEIKKKIKALEIIKEKFYFEWLLLSKNVDQYNEAQDDDKNKLTQEEYNLLKEVLL